MAKGENRRFEIKRPIRLALGIGVTVGLIAAFKKLAPVPRNPVLASAKKFRLERYFHSTGYNPYTLSWEGEYILKTFNPVTFAADLRQCMTGTGTGFACKTDYTFMSQLNQNEIR